MFLSLLLMTPPVHILVLIYFVCVVFYVFVFVVKDTAGAHPSSDIFCLCSVFIVPYNKTIYFSRLSKDLPFL